MLVARNYGFESDPDDPLDVDHTDRREIEQRIVSLIETRKKSVAEDRLI